MKEILNQKFGKWEVIQYSHFNTSKYRHLWKCRCDCGIEKIIREDTLLGGLSKSCGCVNRHRSKNNRRWKGFEEISATYWNKIKMGAKRRGYDFSLTIEDAWKLFIKQNKKCALTGLDISFSKKVRNFDGSASLDRIDNDKGYRIDNVQWIDKRVNTMKMDLPQSEFLGLCKLISNKML